ncbi:aromatic-ring hydroxylase C-terminal domain-containing protein, partial [Mycobacterium kansasii]
LLDLGGGEAADAAHGWRDRVDIVQAELTDRPATAMLIRPDGYIAWATDEFASTEALHTALQRWFG